jgi:lysophospholipid acyltransferase (LPLAT)-like uncharacterized protein
MHAIADPPVHPSVVAIVSQTKDGELAGTHLEEGLRHVAQKRGPFQSELKQHQRECRSFVNEGLRSRVASEGNTDESACEDA